MALDIEGAPKTEDEYQYEAITLKELEFFNYPEEDRRRAELSIMIGQCVDKLCQPTEPRLL